MSKRIIVYRILCILPALAGFIVLMNTEGDVLGMGRKPITICTWLLYASGFVAAEHLTWWMAGGFLRSYLMGEAICWDCLRVVPARDDGFFLCPTCPNQTGPNRLRHRRNLPEYLKRLWRPTMLVKRERTSSLYVLGGAFALGILGFVGRPIPSAKWLVVIAAAVALFWMFYLAISDFVFRRRAKQEIAAGTWRCWVCQYRVDTLPPEVERCPECGAVIKISAYEWRRWLGLATA